MREVDRRTAVDLIDVAAFALILSAALALGLGLVSKDGSGLAIVALVSSLGGWLFLGLGMVRRSEPPPSSD